MTTITVNGEQVATDALTLLDLVAEQVGVALDATGRPSDGSRLGIAVAVDQEVVPRGTWAGQSLAPDADIEIVTAKQGG